MRNELHESFATITDEEKAGAAAHIRAKIEAIVDQDDGPIRARIFAASTLVAGAELFAELHSPQVAAAQLRRLADRLDAGAGVKH